MRGKRKSTLCWDCQNAYYGKCSWFTDFTPVEDWEAIETIIKNTIRTGSGSYILHNTKSYRVDRCPNFVRDKKQKTNKELANELGISERTLYRKKGVV